MLRLQIVIEKDRVVGIIGQHCAQARSRQCQVVAFEALVNQSCRRASSSRTRLESDDARRQS